jgi:hypothetical protein
VEIFLEVFLFEGLSKAKRKEAKEAKMAIDSSANAASRRFTNYDGERRIYKHESQKHKNCKCQCGNICDIK